MGPIWRVRMLGGLQADSEDMSITRFRTRRVGLLLAYLSFYPNRSHSREELAELLWPDADPENAKSSLRQSLASLRRHLEPPGVPAGAVLDASRSVVSINSQLVTTDVSEFRRLLQAGLDGTSDLTKALRAIDLYRGDLLPGYYEDWVLRERLQLEDQYVAALRTCIRAAEGQCQFDEAIRLVRLALSRDAFQETLHANLINLYLSAGRPRSAIQHFEAWRAICEKELGSKPDTELTHLIESLAQPYVEQQLNAVPPMEGVEAPTVDEPAKRIETVSRLPLQLTRFFGRHREIGLVMEGLTVSSDRLISLVGPAGTGKTRFSIEVGKRMSEAHGWNVWFVPLADISDGAELTITALAAMKVSADAASAVEVLSDRLSEGRNLLILDNLEHILDEAAKQIEAILQGVPNVSLLVTSRQAVKLGGEREVELATLPIPSSEELETPDLLGLATIPSVQLFVDRSQAVLPDFQLTAHNARPISQICARLDGLPLALELAASLSSAFSPPQLLQNLENRLELLQSRRRDLTGRHRSLRLAIDYSYHLLTPELQRFFTRLSVFRGGFTIDAAKRICLDPDFGGEGRRGGQDGACLRMILDLQERSFVQPHDAKEDSPARFKLMESYREYGREMLSQDAIVELKRRHAEYFLELSVAQTLPPEDRDNRNDAVRTLYDQRAISECTALLGTYAFFAPVDREVIHSLTASREFNTFNPLDQARLLQLRVNVLVYDSNYEDALRDSIRARDIAAAHGLTYEVERSSARISLSLSFLERTEEAIAQAEINLELAQKSGNLMGAQTAHSTMGAAHQKLGNFEQALAGYEGARAVCRERREGRVDWLILYNLSIHYLEAGKMDEGLRYAAEALHEARDVNDEFGIVLGTSAFARYYLEAGNIETAFATNQEVLKKVKAVGFRHWISQAIFSHAMIMIETKAYRDTTILLAATTVVAKANPRAIEVLLARLHAALSPSEFAQAWAEGLTMTTDQAFKLALQYA